MDMLKYLQSEAVSVQIGISYCGYDMSRAKTNVLNCHESNICKTNE